MATTKGKAKKGKNRGDSPITVGGGRRNRRTVPVVDLKFNHNVYLSDPKDTDNWISSEPEQLANVVIDGGARKTAVSKVVIKYQGGEGKIIIQGNPVAVRFKGLDLPYKNGKHHGEFAVKSVTIDRGTPILVTTDAIITVHTK